MRSSIQLKRYAELDSSVLMHITDAEEHLNTLYSLTDALQTAIIELSSDVEQLKARVRESENKTNMIEAVHDTDVKALRIKLKRLEEELVKEVRMK